jgi:hypothetical protein
VPNFAFFGGSVNSYFGAIVEFTFLDIKVVGVEDITHNGKPRTALLVNTVGVGKQFLFIISLSGLKLLLKIGLLLSSLSLGNIILLSLLSVIDSL